MPTTNPLTPLRIKGERSRTIKFFTLGCKANQYDTQEIRERFLACGYQEISNGQKSDIYLINTCTVTQHADHESLQLIRRAKNRNPGARIIVTGCLTELDTVKIKNLDKRIMIIKNRDKQKIINFLDKRNETTKQRNNETTKNGISYFQNHTRAFLKIQDGCDNFCSYCKVPLVRGRAASRERGEILAEAGRLVKNGYKEIVLTGICLGSFGRDLRPKENLVSLLRELEKMDGLDRIRLSSIEPQDIDNRIIELLAKSKKLCRHLHIPLQSGDDEILKKMRRKYTVREYLQLIKKIRKKIPQIAITTDCLVGFPGESEKNFQHTLKLIKEVNPLKVHIFPYSSRPGTLADNFFGQLNAKIIQQRISQFKQVSEGSAKKFKSLFLNKKMSVLIEGQCKGQSGIWEGFTDNYIPVFVESKHELKNQLVQVRLKKLFKQGAWGSLADQNIRRSVGRISGKNEAACFYLIF